jgi:glycosyltransferase involved in cell wall biosynthesis
MSYISVIIPVYNCGQFLRRCLDSLVFQSFKDWEAICINDGSKDNSGDILDEYAAADKRFKVVHKENEGVSAARNTALKHVESDYIMFMDSDDFLHPQAMEICRHFAERDDSDLVAYTYNRRYRTLQMIGNILNIPEAKRINYRRYDIDKIKSLTTDDIFHWATEYSHPEPGQDKRWIVKHCQPWRCMYRSSMIKDIRFIKGIIYEDFPWWGEVMTHTSKATIINLPIYYYYPNKGSYILSSKEQYRIKSLRTALKAARQIVPDDEKKLMAWNLKFIVPFEEKLEKKLRKVRSCEEDS